MTGETGYLMPFFLFSTVTVKNSLLLRIVGCLILATEQLVQDPTESFHEKVGIQT